MAPGGRPPTHDFAIRRRQAAPPGQKIDKTGAEEDAGGKGAAEREQDLAPLASLSPEGSKVPGHAR